MQVVINIPTELYEQLMESDADDFDGFIEGELVGFIQNGTPLPKGHGKIGDLDRLYNVFEKNVVSADAFKELFDHAPTIIDADTESEG